MTQYSIKTLWYSVRLSVLCVEKNDVLKRFAVKKKRQT